MKPQLVRQTDGSLLREIEAQVADLMSQGKPVRVDVPGGRFHIDRPLPFLVVHVGDPASAAHEAAAANASYLTTTDIDLAKDISALTARHMSAHCGAFLLLDLGEFAKDRFLSDDDPFLPPFEIGLAAGKSDPEQAALARFSKATQSREARYRTPRVTSLSTLPDGAKRLPELLDGVDFVTIRFAPIYKVPGDEGSYPALRERIVANILDSGLQAVATYLEKRKLEPLATHRALGRRAIVESVTRADREIDKVAASFDFLLAVTPINAEAAWQEFEAGGFEAPPAFLYRPLTVDIAAAKRSLYAISLDQLEDPLLAELYTEKRQELDLQLSMLEARETSRFIELSRALYGSVEPSLIKVARSILAAKQTREKGQPPLNCDAVAGLARDMISSYRRSNPDFDASVEIRADIPSGLMVTGNRLLVSRASAVSPGRIDALLSHEIGVHLLTYYNGAAQGLLVMRSGLAGYEAMQEGLAVLAEYLAGGMNSSRMQLLAARVLGCDAMLSGATFPQAFRLLVDDCGLNEVSAFNVALRLYRGGGLAKDAIYLRGLGQVLDHLRRGGSLTPFWMGKVSVGHFEAMQELAARGLLHAPRLEPLFLSSDAAKPRLKKAMAGLEPIDMLAD